MKNKTVECPSCGAEMDSRSATCRKCWNDNRKYPDKLHSSGRFLVHKGGRGFVYRSRLISEDRLGRRLKDGEVVHHVNGNFQDDRPENLLICSNSYHRDLHNRMADCYMQKHLGGT